VAAFGVVARGTAPALLVDSGARGIAPSLDAGVRGVVDELGSITLGTAPVPPLDSGARGTAPVDAAGDRLERGTAPV
jgi:hypothetical protein